MICKPSLCYRELENNHNREKRDLDLRVTGLRLDIAYKEVEIDDYGAPYVRVGTNNTLRLFGTGFSEDMLVTFTSEQGVYGGGCQLPIAKYFPVSKNLPFCAMSKLFTYVSFLSS